MEEEVVVNHKTWGKKLNRNKEMLVMTQLKKITESIKVEAED